MIGTTLGHYKLTAKLGEGGMGEVYRAEDTKLGREVALKVLPEALAQDEERLARFEREAKVLAALNHPEIAGIHSLEDDGDTRFLTMELVEGEGLDQRIAREALPVEDAVEIARQIAGAVEAAHEQGIVHRDLKPANVMLTSEGRVKVLDFGLAKAAGPGAGSGSGPLLSQSPTITHQMTQAGVLMGTAAYMSPEQARGQEADKRSDIWSFGVVLLEMLTGKNTFGGDTVSDTLAAVLRAEPEFDELPASAPAALRLLLARCLEKDPRQRLRDIGEARILLQGDLGEAEPAEASLPPAVAHGRSPYPWLIAALAIVAVTLLGWRALSLRAGASGVRHVSVALPPGLELGGLLGGIEISPDGNLVAFTAGDESGANLYVRDLTTGETRLLEGTKDATSPFFSPDGRWLGFQSGRSLYKVSSDGGVPVELTSVRYMTGSWGEDGTIVFNPRFNDGLFSIPATGGSPVALTQPRDGEMGHFYPQILPGGEHVLFTAVTAPVADSKLVLLSLRDGSLRTVRERASHGRVTANGLLVFTDESGLWAAEWDAKRLEVSGPAVRVREDTSFSQADGCGFFSISADGTLAYFPRSLFEPELELLSLDRSGRASLLVEERARWRNPALSPDGLRIALAVETESDAPDIWIYSLDSGRRTRVTADPRTEYGPQWLPDGGLVYSQDEPPYNLFEIRADGSGKRRLFADENDKSFDAVSSDGRLLAFSLPAEDGAADIWFLERTEGEPRVRPFFEAPGAQFDGTFSPDGRYLAYHSNETGRGEVYVRPLSGGQREQVSIDGGRAPLWRGDEVFFRNKDEFLSARVETAGGLRAEPPRLLFRGDYRSGGNARNYDVSSDGQRIIVLRTPQGLRSTRANLILNWFTELERKYAEGIS